MFCTENERKTCNVEKMGCEGCYYNNDFNRDIEILRAFTLINTVDCISQSEFDDVKKSILNLLDKVKEN
jgi:hypothetical protein